MSILESEWFRKLIKFGILSLFLFGPASTFASASESCPSESELVGNICVTDLSDPEGEVAEIDPSNPNQSITLRMAVTAINESAAATSPTSSIYFDAALFNSNTSESTIALSSSLEIKSNIRIIAPIAADSSILLTITRSENMETNVALIVVNPDSPAAIIDSDFANREIIIENVKINSAANSESISTTSGRAIEVRQSDSPTSEISSGPTLELRNVVIENSVSQEGGGAITSSADVTIENSILKNNISIGSGGAISAMETVTVIDSNFESNTAVRPAGSNPATENGPEGGAIYSEGKVVSSNTIFSTNVAEIGGAISARSVEINQSVFISNQANLVVDGDASWFGMGGAIALKGAGEENLIEDSEFALNSAGSGGALVVNTPAEFPAITNLVISATTFSSNVASADPDFALGGALLVPFEVSVEIKDETLFIENSSAGSGGAIAVQGGFRPKGDENLESGLTISNSSFVSNIATNDGGAIHVSSITPSNLNISYDVSISTMPFNNLVEVEAEYVTPTTFAGNSAGFYGGAIFMSSLSGEAKISEVSFIENHAEDGGALYIEHPNFNFGYFEFDLGEIDPLDFVNSWQESSTVVESSTFSENSASGVGGAIYAEDEVVIHESQFLENMAAEYGGAIAAQRVEIDKSFFTSNYACAEIEFDEEDDGYRCVQPPASDSEQNQFNGNGGAIALEMRYNEDFADVFFNVFTNPDFDSDIPQGIAALLEESINVPSIITSSIFEENEAGSEGGAVWGYAWLFFNSLLNNRAEVGSAVSLQDFQYDLVNQQMYLAPNNLISQLVGNFFTADSAEGSLCSIPFHLSFFNQVSDSSCTLLEEEVISTLEETFGLTVDISSIDFNPEDFPEGKLPDSILSSDSVARFEEIFREDLDTFIIGSGPVSNEFLGTSPGLNISIGSLIIDIESVLINGNLAGPEFIYLDSSRLNSLMDSIFGRGEETVGIKRDISGAVRPSDGCWTFGAFQFAEAFDCLAVPEGSLVQNPEAAKIPDSQFRGAGSSWKPRVPTERDLARRARLAALKLKIAAIKLERERRKSSIGKAQALPLKKPLGSKSAKKMDLRFAMH